MRARLDGRWASAIAVLFLCSGCDSGSGADSGSAPQLTNLQVVSVQRVASPPNGGVLSLRFDFTDLDRDLRYIYYFGPEGRGGGAPINDSDLSGSGSGSLSLLVAVTLPAPGTTVPFGIYSRDARLNESNELRGSFVAP